VVGGEEEDKESIDERMKNYHRLHDPPRIFEKILKMALIFFVVDEIP